MANTKASLTQQNTQTYPSNTSGSITALAVKSFNNNFINAVATLGDTNVFTEPQTFGDVVQVNSNVIANNFIGPLIGTASWAINALTASYAEAANVDTGSFATTGSNTFTGLQIIDTGAGVTIANGAALSINDGSGFYDGSGNVGTTGQVLKRTATGYRWQNDNSGSTIDTGSLVTSASFNAYTASTNTFTSSIQTQVNALRAATASYATTGSNTFNGTNTFTGSLNAQSASIQFLIVDTIVSSSTINATGSNILGDASNDTQTLWGTVLLPSGPLQVTGSVSSTGGFTGSLQGTASYADQALSASWAPFVATPTSSLLVTASVSLNTITFTKGDASTFDITVNTGSAGGSGFATTGSNVFSGSQTFNTASLILNASGSQPTFTNFTQSLASSGGAYANVLLFPNNANSGSFILSGSRNIGTVNPVVNASTTTLRGGGNLNGNFGNFSIFNSTASSPATLTNNFVGGAVTNALNNTSSTVTLTGNFIGGTIITTGSATSNVAITTNNIDAAIITNDFTGSGASQNVSVVSNLIKGGTTQPNFAQIKFAATQSNGNSRTFTNNIMFGPANIASLEASGAVSLTSHLVNTAIIGSNLVVSGTMASNSLSASMFVGQFNDVTLADPSLHKFVVGTGTTTAARRTSFLISGSGEVQIRPNGDGQGISTFGPGRATKIADGNVNGTLSTVAATNAVFNVNSVTNNGSQLSTIMSAETSTNTSAANSVMMAGASLTMTNGTLNVMSGESNQMLNAARSIVLGGVNNVMSSSYGSAIIGGSNVASIRMNTSTGSVALPRDAAYTASANYTLFTQNVNLSGSLVVNGNTQYNFGEFFSSASVTPSAGVSASIVFDTTAESNNVAISGSGALIKITNAGTYNIQFSTQTNTSAGADTLYVWFKKNGTNISNSASKVVLANNTAQLMTVNILDSAAANDYYEIAYQSANGNVQILAEAASGNIPAIPSVILTVTQVK